MATIQSQIASLKRQQRSVDDSIKLLKAQGELLEEQVEKLKDEKKVKEFGKLENTYWRSRPERKVHYHIQGARTDDQGVVEIYGIMARCRKSHIPPLSNIDIGTFIWREMDTKDMEEITADAFYEALNVLLVVAINKGLDGFAPDPSRANGVITEPQLATDG